MNIATDTSIVQLVMESSLMVKAVLVLLLLASIISWVIIFAKRFRIKHTIAEMEWFEDRFWSGGNVRDIYNEIHRHEAHPHGMPALFKSGYEELERQRGREDMPPARIVPSVQRAMRVAMSRELERLETGLAFLATVGSISPYVGLFGTVWGIMSAFIGLGQAKQADLTMVAPGIAEALIATAMGLFAAIPAVVAYNLYSSRLEFLENRFDTFMEEMSGIVERGMNAASPVVRERASQDTRSEPVRTAPEL